MKAQTFLLVLLGILIACQARADNPPSTVEVRAVGVVTVPSDTVVLRLSIATCHADIQEAKKRNDQIAAPIYQLAETQHAARPMLLATRVSFDFAPQQPGANQGDEKGQINQGQANQVQANQVQSNQAFGGRKGGKKGAEYGPAEPPEPPVHMSRDLEMTFRDLDQAIRFLAEAVKWDAVRTTCELKLAPLSFGVANRANHSDRGAAAGRGLGPPEGTTPRRAKRPEAGTCHADLRRVL